MLWVLNYPRRSKVFRAETRFLSIITSLRSIDDIGVHKSAAADVAGFSARSPFTRLT